MGDEPAGSWQTRVSRAAQAAGCVRKKREVCFRQLEGASRGSLVFTGDLTHRYLLKPGGNSCALLPTSWQAQKASEGRHSIRPHPYRQGGTGQEREGQGSLGCCDREMELAVQDAERTRKAIAGSPGLQESQLWSLQEDAWKKKKKSEIQPWREEVFRRTGW